MTDFPEDVALADLDEAAQQAALAYQFTPSSYTYHAMRAALAAADRIRRQPDWISEMLDWGTP
jgi:hypothetical protein